MDYTICGVGIAIFVLVVLLLIVFVALPLYLTARLLDEDEGLLKAFGTTFLLILAFILTSWLGLIGLILAIAVNLLIIKSVYETTWGKAFVMWIVTIIMAVVIVVIVFTIAGVGYLMYVGV